MSSAAGDRQDRHGIRTIVPPAAKSGRNPSPVGPTVLRMTDAIVVEGLVKRFGNTTALDGVSLTVAEGTVLGLLGPNGAGKTTVVRILTTLLAADAGRAEVVGLDVVRDADRVRAAIGLTGQYAAVDEYLTGFENLVMVGRLYRLGKSEDRARATELLDRFDLAEAAGRTAKTYSGGMRRRLDIAASLIARPRVLFSTSRRRGWTRAAGSACGTSSQSSPTAAPRSCSPPSTWR